MSLKNDVSNSLSVMSTSVAAPCTCSQKQWID